MWCKFHIANENFVALTKNVNHAGINGNLIINFAWPKVKLIKRVENALDGNIQNCPFVDSKCMVKVA